MAPSTSFCLWLQIHSSDQDSSLPILRGEDRGFFSTSILPFGSPIVLLHGSIKAPTEISTHMRSSAAQADAALTGQSLLRPMVRPPLCVSSHSSFCPPQQTAGTCGGTAPQWEASQWQTISWDNQHVRIGTEHGLGCSDPCLKQCPCLPLAHLHPDCTGLFQTVHSFFSHKLISPHRVFRHVRL